MYATRRLRRSAALCALACAAPTFTATAAAEPTRAALAQEHYYSSYGEPRPLSAAQPTAPSDEAPWLPITLSVAGALAIAGGGATQLRRRRAAHTPA